ncbi:MAG: thiamine biosynthesis protein [Desulfobulbaceae bacterium]|nr:thiamine biosynthesis protein [Desulfobulbaceae bacterium]
MVTALSLYSGGLDSILSCRVVAAQGIRVKAIRFVTPFFGYELLAREQEYAAEVMAKYGIEVVLRDVSEPYLEMLKKPAHGYGKNFNPCVDCKIMLMTEARKMLAEQDASFLISGEVMGQRPMSQRKDTLRLIERKSGNEDILLRPLCAKSQPPTKPEREGLIDREQLLDFRGRTRQPQMQLAASFGITDYPSPAGGCALTDPILAKRIEAAYAERDKVSVSDVRLLLIGRQFKLPHGGWLCMGRQAEENEKVAALQEPEDFLLNMEERPGPTALLRYPGGEEDFIAAAGLVVRFGKKVPAEPETVVEFVKDGRLARSMISGPLADDLFKDWYR